MVGFWLFDDEVIFLLLLLVFGCLMVCVCGSGV